MYSGITIAAGGLAVTIGGFTATGGGQTIKAGGFTAGALVVSLGETNISAVDKRLLQRAWK